MINSATKLMKLHREKLTRLCSLTLIASTFSGQLGFLAGIPLVAIPVLTIFGMAYSCSSGISDLPPFVRNNWPPLMLLGYGGFSLLFSEHVGLGAKFLVIYAISLTTLLATKILIQRRTKLFGQALRLLTPLVAFLCLYFLLELFGLTDGSFHKYIFPNPNNFVVTVFSFITIRSMIDKKISHFLFFLFMLITLFGECRAGILGAIFLLSCLAFLSWKDALKGLVSGIIALGLFFSSSAMVSDGAWQTVKMTGYDTLRYLGYDPNSFASRHPKESINQRKILIEKNLKEMSVKSALLGKGIGQVRKDGTDLHLYWLEVSLELGLVGLAFTLWIFLPLFSPPIRMTLDDSCFLSLSIMIVSLSSAAFFLPLWVAIATYHCMRNPRPHDGES